MLRTFVLKVIAPLCITLLLLEVLLRIGGFFWFGFSQYYLFYGFHNLVGRVGVRPDTTFTGSYYKFPPNYVLQGAAGQASDTASTNSLGFRGPEFHAVKPEGTFRIICLGESSTFGFRNSDTGTYPFQLGKLFQQQKNGKTIEVINAGFPYYNSSSILSLLKEELLSYRPDVLTIYSAYNDTGWPLNMSTSSKIFLWIRTNSITYLFLQKNIITDDFVYNLQKKQERIMRKYFHRRSIHYVDYTDFDDQLDHIAMRYRNNITKIVEISKQNNIPLIFIKQPMTTKYKWYESLSYENEYTHIMNDFNKGLLVSPVEQYLVRHHRLVEELEKIAEEQHIPLVDNIAIVDQDKQRLASWVHLTEEANLRLAETLFGVIEPYIDQKNAQ